MSTIPDRIERLRSSMREIGLTHYLVPSSDEHLNEYLPERNQRRQWASGFTGSAGDLLVGLDADSTILFVDGRYHIQAERQLRDSGIRLARLGKPGTKSLSQTLTDLSSTLGARLRVGIDPFVLSNTTARTLRLAAESSGGALVSCDSNLVDAAWSDRPPIPGSALVELSPAVTGANVEARTGAVRAALAAGQATATIVVKLDQIAWLLNLRAFGDVPYNPVFQSFLYIDAESVRLFVHGGSQRADRKYRDANPSLAIAEYDEFRTFLASTARRRMLVDADRVTFGLAELLRKHHDVVDGNSPIEWQKARKNDVEIEEMERANLAASVGKTRAILGLRADVERGVTTTEQAFRASIENIYESLPGFRSLSFSTISAAGDHAALPHYGDADESPLRPGSLFIIDSGIQIGAGTTDDTRTLGIGAVSPRHREIFTLVLKAHIQGAAAVFPEGTTGVAIDAIVRAPLWAAGLNYEHGTGHGVGALLNVHEGPFTVGDALRRPASTYPLEPGMVTSIEPGSSEIGFGGVRHENLYRVVEHHTDSSGKRWLGFASLTFIPFDVSCVDRSLLDRREAQWLDAYHAACVEKLAPFLDESERAGLRRYLGSSKTP